MAYKDLHNEPFDDGTKAKLEIFEDYAQAWIPTFVMQAHVREIHIFDFFSGTGYDKNGIAGSPIRILEKLNEQIDALLDSRIEIVVHFNEFEPNKSTQEKFDQLCKACKDYLIENPNLTQRITPKFYNEDFVQLFPKLLPTIKAKPSLVYLDQNGIKFLSDTYILELEKTKQTDFLYFVSSSYFWRFGDKDEFKKHFEIDLSAAKSDPYKFIHRNVISQLKDKLPEPTTLKLYPYSIKKGANVHGIIFGATHPRAVDKFLSIAWRRNETNGEANFDIDDDVSKGQIDMFEGKKLTKLEGFKENLEKLILDKKLTNNSEILDYVYSQGHIGRHASEVLKELKKAGKVTFDGSSLDLLHLTGQ